jgi:PTH1 family peptidyl-tRNA hydrolase
MFIKAFHQIIKNIKNKLMKYLIVGLGNIGEEYRNTRHNIGFDVVDAFAAKHGAHFTPGRLADVAECRWKGRSLVLIKPTTYMNLSGKAVRYWMDKEKITLDRLLVIVDDLALPLETIRVRPAGSDAGHNGLKSIQELLGTVQYPRLRFGIGNDYPKGRQVDFVLSPWNPAEKPVVQQKIATCVDIIECFATQGVQAVMNRFNQLKAGHDADSVDGHDALQ